MALVVLIVGIGRGVSIGVVDGLDGDGGVGGGDRHGVGVAVVVVAVASAPNASHSFQTFITNIIHSIGRTHR